jgi:hypothetical protein
MWDRNRVSLAPMDEEHWRRTLRSCRSLIAKPLSAKIARKQA